mgnify:CR=1 FL=1
MERGHPGWIPELCPRGAAECQAEARVPPIMQCGWACAELPESAATSAEEGEGKVIAWWWIPIAMLAAFIVGFLFVMSWFARHLGRKQ